MASFPTLLVATELSVGGTQRDGEVPEHIIQPTRLMEEAETNARMPCSDQRC